MDANTRSDAAANAARETCAHEGCGCPPSHEHAPHCSAYCANVEAHEQTAGEGACACEHDPCGASQEVEPSESETRTSVGPS